MANLNNIDRALQARLERALGTLATVLGNEAVNWTKQNFKRGGWPGDGFQPWKPRKANSRRNAGRAILVDSARLSRSPRLIRASGLRAEFGTDVPYAKAHNEGFQGDVAVKAHQRARFGTVRVSSGKSGRTATRRMWTGQTEVKAHTRRMNLPRRKFIGNSPVLTSILRRKAVIHVAQEMRK